MTRNPVAVAIAAFVVAIAAALRFMADVFEEAATAHPVLLGALAVTLIALPVVVAL